MKAVVTVATPNQDDYTVDLTTQFTSDVGVLIETNIISIPAEIFSMDATIERVRDALNQKIIKRQTFPITQMQADEVVGLILRAPD